MKFEVLEDCQIVVKKGSVVIVDPLQYELARRYLKPYKETVKKPTKK